MADVLHLLSVKSEVYSNSTNVSDQVDLISRSSNWRILTTDTNLNEMLPKINELNRNISESSDLCKSAELKSTVINVNRSEVHPYDTVKKETAVVNNYVLGRESQDMPESIKIKNKLTCPYCQKKFESISSLEKHKEFHSVGWPFTCKICRKGFPFHHLLESHMTFHKTELFPCHSCDKICVSRYKLKVHSKLHGNQFFCRICKQTFISKEYLKSHKNIHKKTIVKKQIYVCNICSAKFPVSVELKSHLRMHASNWPFSCEVCKKLYRRRGSFLTHMSKCLGMNPYTCDLCNKSFIRQCHFVQHVKQIHEGVRPFSCNTCHKRFNSKSNLEIHSQVHSARLPTIYKCSLCQKMFNSSRKLRGHKIREHSIYRPYKCSTCKKIFIFKSQLSNHSKEHKVKEL